MNDSSDYRHARLILAGGNPLPVDLEARLLADGYDVAEIIRKHA